MYAPLRTFPLGLICSLLTVSSDAAVNGSTGACGFGAFFSASMADPLAPGAWATLGQHLPKISVTEVLNMLGASGATLTNSRNETYGNTASGDPRKEYGYRCGLSPVTA